MNVRKCWTNTIHCLHPKLYFACAWSSERVQSIQNEITTQDFEQLSMYPYRENYQYQRRRSCPKKLHNYSVQFSSFTCKHTRFSRHNNSHRVFRVLYVGCMLSSRTDNDGDIPGAKGTSKNNLGAFESKRKIIQQLGFGSPK